MNLKSMWALTKALVMPLPQGPVKPKPKAIEIDSREGALLVAMGCNPAIHAIHAVARPRKGLQVFERGTGKPVKFLTEKQLRDPRLRRVWRQALMAAGAKPAGEAK